MLALSEGIARDRLFVAAAFCSVVVLALGVMSDYLAMMVAGIAVGVAGLVLVVLALGRKWSAGRQWLLIAALFAVNISMMVIAWKLGT